MAVPNFLGELQSRQAQVAAVVDERGTVIGFAFREDALEEVVGQLGDEFDDPEGELEEIGQGHFEAPGHIALPEVLDRLGFSLPEGEWEDEDTLGGHVMARLGGLAKPGDIVEMAPFKVEVVEASPLHIERLSLKHTPHEDSSDDTRPSAAE